MNLIFDESDQFNVQFLYSIQSIFENLNLKYLPFFNKRCRVYLIKSYKLYIKNCFVQIMLGEIFTDMKKREHLGS
jgi:hypothetical protein